MTISYAPITAGDFNGSLAYHIHDLDTFDPEVAKQFIYDNRSTQPTIVYIYGTDYYHTAVRDFIINMKESYKCLITNVTWQLDINATWQWFDRTICMTTAVGYCGMPNDEVHLHWNPDYDRDLMIHVAPLGNNNTHVYAWTDKGAYADLITWIKKQPRPIGIITRPLKD